MTSPRIFFTRTLTLPSILAVRMTVTWLYLSALTIISGRLPSFGLAVFRAASAFLSYGK